jgi:hypothetical protein
MFRKVGKFTANSVKSTFNVFAWVGAKPLKDSTSSIAKLSKPVFEKPKKIENETFGDAMKRFRLSDADLAAKEKGLTQQVYAYLGLAGALTIYLMYLLFRLDFFLSIIMLGVIGLALCKFYQAHYRRLCIRTKRLDYRFKDWWKHLVGSNGK